MPHISDHGPAYHQFGHVFGPAHEEMQMNLKATAPVVEDNLLQRPLLANDNDWQMPQTRMGVFLDEGVFLDDIRQETESLEMRHRKYKEGRGRRPRPMSSQLNTLKTTTTQRKCLKAWSKKAAENIHERITT